MPSIHDLPATTVPPGHPQSSYVFTSETPVTGTDNQKITFINDEVPKSFWEGLAEADKGELVDMHTALLQNPPAD